MGLTEIIYASTLIFCGIVFLLIVFSFFASRSSSKKRAIQFEQPYERPYIKVVAQEIPVQQREYRDIQQRMKRVS